MQRWARNAPVDSTAPHPARPAPGPFRVPQLTGNPGNEVWNEPGSSRGARGGRGTVGACGMPHLPTLLAWRRWPGRQGHLWGWPLGPCPPPHLPAAAGLGVPGQGSSPGWPGDGSEWSRGEGGPGLWPKCQLAATGLASWPPPRPPALTKQAGPTRASLQTPLIAGPPPAGTPRSQRGVAWGGPLIHQSACYTGGAIHTCEPDLGHLRAW